MIVVLGSANMDLVALADRLPSVGETVTGREFRLVPGGKGANQAIAAARAGGPDCSVAFVGAVGDDANGGLLLDTLAAEGIDTGGVAITSVPTGTAHITVDRAGDNTIVVVPGANGTLTALRPEHRAAIDRAEALVLQLELPLPFVTEAATYAAERDVRVVLTPAPAPEGEPLPAELLEATSLLVPNEPEARLLAGTDDSVRAAAILAESCDEVVMTTGSRGAVAVRKGGPASTVRAYDVEAVDTTAAGDTFVGVLTVALCAGLPMEQALRRATAAAALSVQKVGASTSMPVVAEIDAFLEREEIRP